MGLFYCPFLLAVLLLQNPKEEEATFTLHLNIFLVGGLYFMSFIGGNGFEAKL